MLQNVRYAVAYRFYSYYYFFVKKVIAICDARNRTAVCTVLWDHFKENCVN